jgi:hypothetical protein
VESRDGMAINGNVIRVSISPIWLKCQQDLGLLAPDYANELGNDLMRWRIDERVRMAVRGGSRHAGVTIAEEDDLTHTQSARGAV